jgi:hypothetical protein
LAEVAFKPAPTLTQEPALTLPAISAEAVRRVYGAAKVILEYGSGGSTALAAGMPGKVVFSVESDLGWGTGLRDWFTAHPPKADKVVIHHADIGETGKWGMPVDESGWKSYHQYPLSVWDLPGFLHPDAVLVDGRFRAACFLSVLFKITRPVTLLWDDYGARKPYHEVERLVRPVRMHGRMAEFHLTPMPIPPGELAWVIGQFTRRQ